MLKEVEVEEMSLKIKNIELTISNTSVLLLSVEPLNYLAERDVK